MNQCRKIEGRKEELTSTVAAACRLFTITNRVELWDKMWESIGESTAVSSSPPSEQVRSSTGRVLMGSLV